MENDADSPDSVDFDGDFYKEWDCNDEDVEDQQEED